MSEQPPHSQKCRTECVSQVRCLWMALVKAEQPSLPIVMERSRTILVCEFRNHDFLRSVPLHAYASLKKVTGGNDSVTASDLTWNHVYYV
jgi:hypothetical protein